MRSRSLFMTVLACIALLAASTAAFAGDAWLGTWKLDVAKSKFSPGPAPKSETLTWKAVGGGVQLTSHVVRADGKEFRGGYTTRYDGKEVPWKGNPDADASIATRTNDYGYINVWKKGGEVVMTATVIVSNDGKTMTISQTGKNAKGETVDNTEVYTKE